MLEKDRGIDGNKKANGRKRQFLVDTGGRLWAVKVHAANIADGKGGVPLLDNAEAFKERLEKFLGDTSYNNIFAKEVEKKGYLFEKAAQLNEDAKIIIDTKEKKKFVVEAKRWVV